MAARRRCSVIRVCLPVGARRQTGLVYRQSELESIDQYDQYENRDELRVAASPFRWLCHMPGVHSVHDAGNQVVSILSELKGGHSRVISFFVAPQAEIGERHAVPDALPQRIKGAQPQQSLKTFE